MDTSKRSILTLCLLCTLGVLGVDQVTKYTAYTLLSCHHSFVVFESSPISLFWTLALNTGAAWSFCASCPHLLLVYRCLILSVLVITWTRIKKREARLWIALIIGGALSNILDMWTYGAVVDFIHFRFGSYDYPIFNFADTTIFIAISGLVYSTRH